MIIDMAPLNKEQKVDVVGTALRNRKGLSLLCDVCPDSEHGLIRDFFAIINLDVVKPYRNSLLKVLTDYLDRIPAKRPSVHQNVLQ